MGRIKGGHNSKEKICRYCGKNEVVSRGLCNACYLRWQRYGNCEYRRPKKTNADRIRSMSDAELAVWLYWKADGSGKTKEQWLEWLREERNE